MTRIQALQAAGFAALLMTSLSSPAQAKLDAYTMKAFGGTYSSDCGNPAVPQLRVTAEALFVEQGKRRMQANSPQSAVSFFGQSPPPSFQTALMG